VTSRSSVAATTKPARRMPSIWAGVLISSRSRLLNMSGTDRGEQPVTDKVDRTQRVYLHKETTRPVLTG
jgi:hypothetical protein